MVFPMHIFVVCKNMRTDNERVAKGGAFDPPDFKFNRY